MTTVRQRITRQKLEIAVAQKMLFGLFQGTYLMFEHTRISTHDEVSVWIGQLIRLLPSSDAVYGAQLGCSRSE